MQQQSCGIISANIARSKETGQAVDKKSDSMQTFRGFVVDTLGLEVVFTTNEYRNL